MKVLMFGWEFPPKIYGGLAVASYGITKGLSLQGDVETTFCMPRPTGEEEKFLKIVNMSQVPVVWRDVNYDWIKDRFVGHTAEDYYRFRDHLYADFNYLQGLDDLGCIGFAGGYPGNLHEEINNFSIIAGVLARSEQFDLIHAHDWLTYPAGVHAKMVSGKPLCIHVHATDFDRSRGKVNPTVYSIEKNGMDHADCIMCVSELTRQTVINQYHQDPRKCVAMHNAVYPLSDEIKNIEPHKNPDEKVVTYLGRITMQKGPEYFIEAAKRVLDRSHNIRFCFAGSGDMMHAMIDLAAAYGIADRCHFPGFQRGKQVYECYRNSRRFRCLPSAYGPRGAFLPRGGQLRRAFRRPHPRASLPLRYPHCPHRGRLPASGQDGGKAITHPAVRAGGKGQRPHDGSHSRGQPSGRPIRAGKQSGLRH